MRQAEIRIETVLSRMSAGADGPNTEMPLANHAGGIAACVEKFGQGDFIWLEVTRRTVAQDAKFVMTHPTANGVTTRQERGATGRADFACRVEIGEPHPLGGHTVE